jgi:hypothetical protein
MADSTDISAWIVLFLGLYAVSAAIGELRKPGSWAAMLEEFEQREGLRFLAGLVVLALGAAIYLVNPWNPGDWLAVLVTVLGGALVLEGMVIFAFGRAYLHLAAIMLGTVNRLWAAGALALGLVMVCLALLRF